MLNRLTLLVLTLVLAAVGCLAVPTTQAHADGTVGISIAPASAHGRDARTRFSYQLQPGQTVTDHVLVSNVGSKKLTVSVFSTDAYNTEDGSFALLDTAEKAKDAGSWVRFSGQKRTKVTLAPHEARIVAFTVSVPATAAPGDHPGGIVAAATSTAGTIDVERRIADRMYVRVAGSLQPNLTVSSFSGSYSGGLNPADGTVTVTAVISNSGNVALSGSVTLTARTWFGAQVGTPVQAELDEMLPGASRTISYQLSGVPEVGYVTPHIQLRSAVSGEARDPGPLPVVERDTFLLAFPWIVLIAAALVVVVWFVLRWRRARDAKRAAEWVAYTQAEAQRMAGETVGVDSTDAASSSAEDGATTTGSR